MRSWAEEIADVTNIKVNLLNPGGVDTQMRAKAMPGEDKSLLPTPYDVAPLVVEMLGPDYAAHDTLVSYRDWAAQNG